PLPTSQPSAYIHLTWSGDDGPLSSGVASYDIYVSDNNGPFTRFIQGDADTSTIYVGEYGHTYRFYTVAIDNVDNVEAAPSTPDATISIVDFENQVIFDSATGTFSVGGTTGNDTILIAPDSKGKNAIVTVNKHVLSSNVPLSSIRQIN